jgi:uncharacterized membrane protein
MKQPAGETSSIKTGGNHEPRWPVLLAILVAGGLYSAIAPDLAIGPRGLLLVIIIAISLPALISHHSGYHTVNTVLGYLSEGILTAFLLGSVVLLIRGLLNKSIDAKPLLFSAAAMWLCNVVLFALWYWRLDGGGPYARHARGEHAKGAFLFPPMTDDGQRAVGGDWSPKFVDYLFLAFNTSTALSPTDAPILSRWAKLLVMLQAIISLTLVTVLAARAINIM